MYTIHPDTRVSDSLFATINVFLELEETTRLKHDNNEKRRIKADQDRKFDIVVSNRL